METKLLFFSPDSSKRTERIVTPIQKFVSDLIWQAIHDGNYTTVDSFEIDDECKYISKIIDLKQFNVSLHNGAAYILARYEDQVTLKDWLTLFSIAHLSQNKAAAAYCYAKIVAAKLINFAAWNDVPHTENELISGVVDDYINGYNVRPEPLQKDNCLMRKLVLDLHETEYGTPYSD